MDGGQAWVSATGLSGVPGDTRGVMVLAGGPPVLMDEPGGVVGEATVAVGVPGGEHARAGVGPLGVQQAAGCLALAVDAAERDCGEQLVAGVERARRRPAVWKAVAFAAGPSGGEAGAPGLVPPECGAAGG